MDIEQERFREFSRTKGKMRFEAEGNVQEKDFASVNHINASGTIGYAEVEVEGKPDMIFISKTPSGIVLTMPGEQTGPAPFPVEGYSHLSTVMSGSTIKEVYDAHVQVMAGDILVADSAWLEKEVPLLPQRALDVTMKIFAIVCDQMDKLMSGMGNAMGEMMEGMGKAMGQALEGAAEAAPKAAEELARPFRKASAPKKRARPTGKAGGPRKKVAPVKRARPPKRRAPPARKAASSKNKVDLAQKAKSRKK
jgi:hypothetical protein